MTQLESDILDCMQRSPTKYFSVSDLVRLTKLTYKSLSPVLRGMRRDKVLEATSMTNGALHYYVPGKEFVAPDKIDRVFTKEMTGYTERMNKFRDLCMLSRG